MNDDLNVCEACGSTTRHELERCEGCARNVGFCCMGMDAKTCNECGEEDATGWALCGSCGSRTSPEHTNYPACGMCGATNTAEAERARIAAGIEALIDPTGIDPCDPNWNAALEAALAVVRQDGQKP